MTDLRSFVLDKDQGSSSQTSPADDDRKGDLIRQLCTELEKLPDETEAGTSVISVRQISNLKGLAKAIMKWEGESNDTESVESYYSASDFNLTLHCPVKKIKLDMQYNSSTTRRSPGIPFTKSECILILKTVLLYLDDEEFTCKEVVDLIRNKYWGKPSGNSLQSQYNSKTKVQRNGESLKTKFKSLLHNDAELNDLLANYQSVKKFQGLRQCYALIVPCPKKRVNHRRR